MRYILSLDIDSAKKLLDEAMVGEERDTIFKYYLSIFPQFDKKTYMTFSDYYEKNRAKAPVKTDERTQEEIMEEILSIKF